MGKKSAKERASEAWGQDNSGAQDDLHEDIARLTRRLATAQPAPRGAGGPWEAREDDNGVVHFYDKAGAWRAMCSGKAWREMRAEAETRGIVDKP